MRHVESVLMAKDLLALGFSFQISSVVWSC